MDEFVASYLRSALQTLVDEIDHAKKQREAYKQGIRDIDIVLVKMTAVKEWAALLLQMDDANKSFTSEGLPPIDPSRDLIG